MQKFVFVPIIIISLLFLSSFHPGKTKEELNWLTLEQVQIKLKEQPKPVLIDLYTDWCGWCKVMDKKTYTNQSLIKYLNQKFYVVKLNAETKESISWMGKTYAYNAAYKTNEIAIFFTSGQLSYPTTVIIPADKSAPQPIAGFLETKEMEMVTKYFGENKYGFVSFNDYAKNFKPTWN